ncbi:RLA class II histocompatibility antigen, DP alpha-1 chain-like [Stegostoma tigrinum]|uniref:RLA class II histocompatibility antigen, DP alpha-1 chain-like n=1 Tax=Stegostoma tigrinum TaxID=3053191 RepID=UPI00202AC9C6|nr:RLA class II histocompatibility antigen, DP alpha-1 chain-like [Stegostoma tigrinum]
MASESFLTLVCLLPSLWLCQGSDRWNMQFGCFVADDPRFPGLVCELQVEGRPFIYYDSSLPDIQFLYPGFEDYRMILTEFSQDHGRTVASLRRAMAIAAAVTNHSNSPNEVGEIFLYPEMVVEWGQPNVLVCLVTGLFPPSVAVSLHLDGVPLGSDVNSSRIFFSKGWRFQALWYARIRPGPGHLYSCVVRHNISQEEKVVFWEPETGDIWEESALDSGQLAVLVCGLLLGVVGIIAGILLCCWRPLVDIWNCLIVQMSSCLRHSSSA